jgi:hypothetical protein
MSIATTTSHDTGQHTTQPTTTTNPATQTSPNAAQRLFALAIQFKTGATVNVPT